MSSLSRITICHAFLLLACFTIRADSAFFTPTNEVARNCTVRDTCSLRHFLSGDLRRYGNCACDHRCSLFDDCCHDADFNPISKHVGAIKTDLECRKVYPVHQFRPIFIVSKCPDEYPHDDVIAGCQIKAANRKAARDADTFDDDVMFTEVPVTSNTTSVLYRNIYCAICHGDTDTTIWGLRIYRKTPFGVSDVENGTALKESFRKAMRQRYVLHRSPEGVQPRHCEKTVRACSAGAPEDDIVNAECQRYLSYVYHVPSRRTFRNRHCAECNAVNVTSLTCQGFHTYVYTSTGRRFPSYSILLDFYTGRGTIYSRVGQRDQKEEIVLAKRDCAGQIFDPFQETCRRTRCPVGSRIKYGRCVGETVKNCGQQPTLLTRPDSAVQRNVCLSGNETTEHQNETFGQEMTYAFSVTQGYVTLAGNCFSVVGLSVHLVVYLGLAPLRNLPGQCMICLSASLLVAQVLFTFGIYQTEIHAVCLLLSIVLHFAFLAYFCWMGVLAFDVWKVFCVQGTSSSPAQTGDKRRQFLCYSACAWLTPAAVVAVSAALDQTSSVVRPLYAAHVCWLGSRLGLLVLFAAPVGLILAVNAAFFALTVRYIHKTRADFNRTSSPKASTSTSTTSAARSRTRSTSSQSSTSRDSRLGSVCLYLKLCTIMGLTWLFGFLAALADVAALWYVFVALNTLQGVYICASFVFTRNVLKLLTERCRGNPYLRRLTRGTGSRATTTTTTGSRPTPDGATAAERRGLNEGDGTRKASEL